MHLKVSTWGHFLRPVFTNPSRSAAIFAFVCVATTADLLVPLYSGQLIDLLVGGSTGLINPLPRATYLILKLTGLGAATLLGRFLAGLFLARNTLDLARSTVTSAFRNMLYRPESIRALTHSGTDSRALTRGLSALDIVYSTFFLALTPSLVAIAGLSCILSLRWPLAGMVVLIASLLYVSFTCYVSYTVLNPAFKLAIDSDSSVSATIADALISHTVIHDFGMEERETDRLRCLLNRWARRTRKALDLNNFVGLIQALFLLTFRVALVAFAFLMWAHHRASPGDVTFVLTSSLMVQSYLREIPGIFFNLHSGLAQLNPLFSLADQPVQPSSRKPLQPCNFLAGSIRFEAVSFRYPASSQLVFEDLSLSIAAGEHVGLVGLSGVGKSTLVKLLQRYYDPTSGSIYIDDQDVSLLEPQAVRQKIAVVSQDSVMFARSIVENIRYGSPSASLSEVEFAAKQANAHDFITLLPRGYATRVGERGLTLSGGQRQRIALARAFLVKARILVLDEATANLDSHSESLIQEALNASNRFVTTIVISHRIATLSTLERIVVLHNGGIAEDGLHEGLMSIEGGIYRQLSTMQSFRLF